jgi:antirestriction protein
MACMILKKSKDSKHVIIVNDTEGIPMEWDTYEEAEKIAELFQVNTTHNSIYEIKKIN